jgi:hypothetical protein
LDFSLGKNTGRDSAIFVVLWAVLRGVLGKVEDRDGVFVVKLW